MSLKKPTALQLFNKKLNKKYVLNLFNENILDGSSRGIDGLTAEKFNENIEENLKTILKKCKKGNYKFSRYLELLKSKGRESKPRLISLPTVRDKIVLLVLKEFLHEIYKDCVNHKLPNHYIRELRELLKKSNPLDDYFYKGEIERASG